MAESVEVRLGSGNYRRLARRTGLSHQHISRVLRGLREPSWDVGMLIAREAGVTAETLHAHMMKVREPHKIKVKIKKQLRRIEASFAGIEA